MENVKYEIEKEEAGEIRWLYEKKTARQMDVVSHNRVVAWLRRLQPAHKINPIPSTPYPRLFLYIFYFHRKTLSL